MRSSQGFRERADAHQPNRDDSKRPFTLLVAIAANIALAVSKFIVAAISGSAGMFAEGVHSVVDTFNQGLLLFGARRSQLPADDGHPFGYGKEAYFWTLIYSVFMFAIGGGVSLYEGVRALARSEMPTLFHWSYVVLGVAVVSEGTSWVVALRTLNREEQAHGMLGKLRRASDPSRFVVVAEDSAALLGVIVAFFGLLLSQVFDTHYPDAVASILIGAILCLVALGLTARSRELLIGQAASRETVKDIENIIERTESVHYAGPPLTMHLGPGHMLAAINIKFSGALSSADVARTVDEIEDAIRRRYPEFTNIYIEAQLAERDVKDEQPEAAD